ncbi:MAG: RidA family protein [Rhodobacterales bacterium]|jgi:enamine deaminase RidA (YjgF/YER057c/UK114 family)|nr:RidA family protein [Rhodobacter sp.]HBN31654.1 enamine deaminase RidA [Paracoccaceae bacterium]
MRALTPFTIAPPFGAYSHGIEAIFARVVLTSGQLGMARDGSIPAGIEAQTEICLANIGAILAEAGLGRANILRLNAYVTDRAFITGYMAARDRWLASCDIKPASTLLIVSGFTRPEFIVEIESIAGIT